MISPVKGRFYQPFSRGGIRLSFLMAAIVVVMLTNNATPASILAGSVLLLTGVVLQFWSKACLHQDRTLTQWGPYRFVRHPFYTSCLLIDAGVVVMTGWWPFMLAAAIWWLAVYIPAIREEEGHLRGVFGSAYDDFITRVPMLIPVGRPLPVREHRIDWTGHNVMVTEMPRALRHLTFPLLLVLASMLVNRGVAIFHQAPYPGAWLATGIAMLLLCSLIWRLAFKHGRRSLPPFALRLENRVLYIAVIVMIGLVWDLFDPSTDPLALRVPGLGLLLLSIVLVSTGTRRARWAEAALAMGLAFLFELEWFTLLLIPYYLALFIPIQVGQGRAGTALEQSARLMPKSSFALLSVIGLVGVTFTELWI